MLAGMSPKEFDELYQDYVQRPWGDDWLQASMIACAIINEIRCQLTKDIQTSDLLPLDAMVPKPRDEEDKPASGGIGFVSAMRARLKV
jgi:hypothetical protein